jgi:hypothetical protein
VEEELFPVRIALKQMGVGMVSSIFGLGHDEIKALTGVSKPAAVVVVEMSSEWLIEEMFKNYPGAAGRYFSRPGSVESVQPQTVEHSLYRCDDGSLIVRIAKEGADGNELIRAVLGEARGIEDLSDDFKKSCQEGVKDLLATFEGKVESREARRKLPALIEGFYFDIARDAVKGDGSGTVPLDSVEEYAGKTMGKLADASTKKWKDGVLSVTLDGVAVSDLTQLRLGLGAPEAISMKDALARRKAADAANAAPSNAAYPKPAN